MVNHRVFGTALRWRWPWFGIWISILKLYTISYFRQKRVRILTWNVEYFIDFHMDLEQRRVITAFEPEFGHDTDGIPD